VNDILSGLSDGTFRAHWLNEVLRTPHVTESIKLLLFAVAIEDMDPAGRFSVPREDLAMRIGRGKARVSERLQIAVDAGLLLRLSAGKKGSTAVYAAALNGSACSDQTDEAPDIEKGPPVRTESEHFGSGSQDAEPEPKGPPIRTETLFGSGSQDAKNDDSVRTGGPNDQKKGPPKRDAKVVGGVGEVEELPLNSDDDDFLKTDEAAPRPARKAAAKKPKAAIPVKFSIPEDFAITDEMRTWARTRCPLVDIDLETELFVNHFLDKPEIKRPGWARSWRTWMLRQVKWGRGAESNVRQLRPTGTAGHQPYRNPEDPSVYNEDL
jgi:hypothetical protein